MPLYPSAYLKPALNMQASRRATSAGVVPGTSKAMFLYPHLSICALTSFSLTPVPKNLYTWAEVVETVLRRQLVREISGLDR